MRFIIIPLNGCQWLKCLKCANSQWDPNYASKHSHSLTAGRNNIFYDLFTLTTSKLLPYWWLLLLRHTAHNAWSICLKTARTWLSSKILSQVLSYTTLLFLNRQRIQSFFLSFFFLSLFKTLFLSFFLYKVESISI